MAPAIRQGQRMVLRLLAGFDLVVDGVSVLLPLVAQRLLAFLALTDRPVSRLYVSGNLWPDKSEDRAAANLRSTLWRLRQPGIDLVRCTASRIGLRDAVAVDARNLATFCRRAVAGTLSVGDLHEFDAGHFTLADEILPDWYDEWLLIERERLRQLRLHATDRVCALLASNGRYADAVDVALAAVANEPLRESSHQTLIEIHLAEGNRNEAIRQFHRYRDLVRDGLGLDPSPSIARLFAVLVAS
jgi:DNA-binding SARP family transcriptional activator